MRRFGRWTNPQFNGRFLGTDVTLTGLMDGRSYKVTGTSLSGTQHDWNPGTGLGFGCTYVEQSSASDLTVTGFESNFANGRASGRMVLIKNVNSGVIYFKYLNAGSTANNRLANHVTGGDTPVALGGYACYIHDGNVWVLVAHQQGSMITAAFSAGNYVASGGGTWTVEAGDVSQAKWKLDGNNVHFSIMLNTTTVAQGGAGPTSLTIGNGVWGGFTAVGNNLNTARVVDNNVEIPGSWLFAPTGSTVLHFQKAAAAQFANSTNFTTVQGQLVFEVS